MIDKVGGQKVQIKYTVHLEEVPRVVKKNLTDYLENISDSCNEVLDICSFSAPITKNTIASIEELIGIMQDSITSLVENKEILKGYLDIKNNLKRVDSNDS